MRVLRAMLHRVALPPCFHHSVVPVPMPVRSVDAGMQAVSESGNTHDEEADASQGERKRVGVHVVGKLQALDLV